MATDERRHVIAVLNGKGGVGKTSVTANVGGWLAYSGFRVLVIGLDPSAGLERELGVHDGPNDDHGMGLFDAVARQAPLRVVSDVRPNLDMVVGGHDLRFVTAVELGGGSEAKRSTAVEFAARLEEVRDDYDLVLMDCPPSDAILQRMAVSAADWVLVPMKSDDGSVSALEQIGPMIEGVITRGDNPDVAYLGAVLFAHNTNATKVETDFRANVDQRSGGHVPVLSTVVRDASKIAQESRAKHRLVFEISADAEKTKAEVFAALSRRRRGEKVEVPSQIPPSARKLAGDYARLANEIWDLIDTTGGQQ